MAATIGEPRFIESLYQPHELQTATPLRRLGGYVLDTLLLFLTLFIGYFIWFIIVAPRGQTPGKQLLRMYVMRPDGTRAGGWWIWLRELLVEGLIFGIIGALTLGIVSVLAPLWCVWDRNTQCLWDKVAGTYVAYSPAGFMPSTKGEYQASGRPRPLEDGWMGASAGPATRTAAEDLRDLARLRDDGLVTDEEYEQRRAHLVDRL